MLQRYENQSSLSRPSKEQRWYFTLEQPHAGSWELYYSLDIGPRNCPSDADMQRLWHICELITTTCINVLQSIRPISTQQLIR